MDAHTAENLLNVWGQGRKRTPAQRNELIWSALRVDQSAGAYASLSIGQCNAELVRVYQRLFGGTVEAVADCPDCSARVEFSLSLDDIASGAAREKEAGSHHCETAGFLVDYRLPTTRDVEVAAETRSTEDAHQSLLHACIVDVTRDGLPVAVEDLPASVIADVERSMSLADPHADIRLSLECAACGEQWQDSFDVSEFLWLGLAAWAQRTLYEVHRLALAYGWTESETLAVSPWRRRRYLSVLDS